MKLFYAALFVLATTFTYAAEETSVLKNTPTPADATTATTTQTTQTTTATTAEVAPVACEAKAVKLSPWTVRRLNRVADRQARAEARECCCKDSCCKQECCCKPAAKVLVIENRRACNCR